MLREQFQIKRGDGSAASIAPLSGDLRALPLRCPVTISWQSAFPTPMNHAPRSSASRDSVGSLQSRQSPAVLLPVRFRAGCAFGAPLPNRPQANALTTSEYVRFGGAVSPAGVASNVHYSLATDPSQAVGESYCTCKWRSCRDSSLQMHTLHACTRFATIGNKIDAPSSHRD